MSAYLINQIYPGVALPFIEENVKIGNIGIADERNDVGQQGGRKGVGW